MVSLLQEVEDTDGALPLLELALEVLWKNRNSEGRLTLQAYQEKIGGLTGILEDITNNLYEPLNEQEKECFKWIFLSLVSLGEGKEDTRRRVKKSDLLGFKKYSPELISSILQKMIKSRLIVVTTEEEQLNQIGVKGEDINEELDLLKSEVTVEIAHEIIIRNWEQLRWWLNENRDRLRLLREVEQDAKKWQIEGKKEGFLLSDLKLDQAEDIYKKYPDELSSNAQEFVTKGIEKRDRQRKRTIFNIAGVIVGLFIFSGFATWQWQRVERQRLISEADNLGNVALSQFQSGEGEITALMTAMEAGQKLKQLVKNGESLANYPTIIPLSALNRINSYIQEKNNFVIGSEDTGKIDKVFFTSDGQKIISLSEEKSKIIIWDVTGKKITEWSEPEKKEIEDLAVSPNGKYIVTINKEKKLYIWDLSGKKIAEVSSSEVPDALVGGWSPEEVYISRIVKFSPDSQYIAVASKFGRDIAFFDLSGQKVKEVASYENGQIQALEFTANGQELIIGKSDGMVEFWNWQTPLKVKEFKAHTDRVLKIVASPAGQQILTLGIDVNESHMIFIAKVSDFSGNEISSFMFSEPVKLSNNPDLQKILPLGVGMSVLNLGDITFSPDGQQIVRVMLGEKIVKFYDSTSGELIKNFTISPLFGASVSYSPDGKKMAIAGQGIKLFVLDKSDFIELPVNYQPEPKLGYPTISSLQYSTDGKKLLISSVLVVSRKGNIEIWDLSENKKKEISFEDSVVNLSPDGKSIILINKEGVQKLDLEGNLISQVKDNFIDVEHLLDSFEWGTDMLKQYYSSSVDGNIILTKIRTFPRATDMIDHLRLWDLSTQQVKEFKNDFLSKNIFLMQVSPNGKYIVTTVSGINKIWDTSGNLVAGLPDAKIKPIGTGKFIELSGVAVLLHDNIDRGYN